MEAVENSISILIIEDNPGDQVLLEAHLENTSLIISGITMASTLAEGIMHLQQKSFSLIFLDFFLPDSSGLDAYLKLVKVSPAIPVIILSGLSDTALALKAISLGAQDFILKGEYDVQSLQKSVWYSIERKKNIELLKENNERYDIISKATNDIIWDWNLDTNKVKWIGQGLKNYLPVNTDITNIPDKFWTRALHPDERKNIVRSLHDTIEKGENSWECDYRFLKNDSSYAHINSRGYIIKNEANKAVRMIGSIQDITERKKAELETEQARIEAEEARKTQEQFLANMSHEIRTPMNGVIGMTQLLSATNLNEDQKEFVENIQQSTGNLMAIINDILDLTKIVAGKITLVQKDYLFADLITNCIKMNQYRADEKGILLHCTIDENIPPVLSGDPYRLNQILLNLVSNAIKFTHKGEVNVIINLQEQSDESVALEFIVSDTGIGIAADKIDSIFERFMQVSGDSTRKYGGTGLGLTITKQLIQLLGGSITVRSHQHEGSTFSFYLTLLKGKQQSGDNPARGETSEPNLRNALAGIHILLVEDNLVNQKVAVKLLESQGATVEVANHGKEAIELLKDIRADIILMDIQMPEMDGYEATKIIRYQMPEEVSKLPIIAMTASALISDQKKCLFAGMNDYIAKPYQAIDLYKKILQQLTPSCCIL
ncbi:MAG: hybrid sensor histidine kinase/response regulator [Ferruginibacter sp.]|uniref:response regulator n=1 Tax=Ferruginibacter sp. TaxID=1940288 RepID=UPI0026598ABC|nr:response regulator [Ferruginibacter sp.]MDB5278677.1 hybrid sensor histidine kinase/response regulator [Ferruginibacter sp.]